PLKPGKRRDTLPQALLGITGREVGVGVGPVGNLPLVERDDPTTLPPSELVPQKIAPDGQEPAAERPVSLPTVEPPECAKESLLHQILDLVPVRPRAVEELPQRRHMAVDQRRGCSLLATAVGGDECLIGAGGGCSGLR